MEKWDKQLFFEDVAEGSETHEISIPVTLQRLVMEAGANMDLSIIHHDNAAGIATGAPGAYANSFFIMGMMERLLREWTGLQGTLKKIGSLRMKVFNSVGDTITFKGEVREKHEENASVLLDIWGETDNGQTVSAEASVILPKKS